MSGCRAKDYLKRREPLAWGLAALMKPGPDGKARQKLACLTRIVQGRISILPAFALFNCVQTYVRLNPEETAEFDRLWSLEANEEVRAMELTLVEQMRRMRAVHAEGIEIGLAKGREEGMAKGREEGLSKGREEGRAKGREEGLAMARQLLTRILEQRFGELPATTRRRLAAVRSIERLNRMGEQVLTARSLAELGLA